MLIVCKLQKQTSVPHLGIHGEELRPGQEAQSEHSFALQSRPEKRSIDKIIYQIRKFKNG